MREILKEFKTVQQAYEAYETASKEFVRVHKKNPVSELWLSMVGTGKNQRTNLVCVYKLENKSEYEFYKSL
jgi:hypothetical protein